MATNNMINTPEPFAIAAGGTGVASVTTSPTASAFAGWDANSNLSSKNFLAGYTTTATAAGTTTLVVGSTQQQFFTGVTTQTVVLPVTSTLALGQSFYIVNNSSGVVTVNSSGSNAVQVMAANTTLHVTCILTSGTSAASWATEYAGASSGGTINSGTASQLAYYAGAGTTLSGLATANYGTLSTSSVGVPSVVAVQSVSAYDSGGTTLAANAFTKINLATENFDLSGVFTSSRFTPTVPGIYLACFGLGLGTTNIDATKQYNAVLYKSGLNYRYGSYFTALTTAGISSNGSALVSMNGTTDYLELWGLNPNAATTVATNASALLTYLDVTRVGSNS